MCVVTVCAARGRVLHVCESHVVALTRGCGMMCVCCLCDCSDGYSDDSESDEEVSVKGFKLHKQKLKWVVRAQVKIFGDRDRKRHLYTLVIKAKGRSR